MSSSLPSYICFPWAGIYDLGVYETPKVYEGRVYANMSLSDFPPYKALGDPLVLHGPAPYNPILCSCNRYRIAEGMCICSMNCKTKPLYAWAKENPKAFRAQQKVMNLWRQRWALWTRQKEAVDQQWEMISLPAARQFEVLQDEESPIGCFDCEKLGRNYCRCECENCCRKHCMGCYDDDDRDNY